ncbi:hypothetical protein GCK72_015211 [Caenorhabditis remanei]|uniref:Uncharacterized protein n=1 Tax=Caenorhabditis remanei TaxID=31234 RepID=A0A6A5GVX4_CAERE|nr:hypothetical protein GCK72_015211 [Caenorhabditis remanei]KAF1758751.1 hypothetical protein GCK72_015211 [Caenorhabditis remanei]
MPLGRNRLDEVDGLQGTEHGNIELRERRVVPERRVVDEGQGPLEHALRRVEQRLGRLVRGLPRLEPPQLVQRPLRLALEPPQLEQEPRVQQQTVREHFLVDSVDLSAERRLPVRHLMILCSMGKVPLLPLVI